MGEAIGIERRLADLFARRRDRTRSKNTDQETPRETERRAMEQLYGEPHRAVVRAEQRPKGGSE